MRSYLTAGALALSAAACSSDPPVLLDASTTDADPSAQCLIPTSYGALGTKTGTADVTTANSLTIVLEPGPPKDDLFFNLKAGKGAFTGGPIKTGTFTITGADASFNDCGLCTNLIADIVAGQGPSKFYYADSGTVTLTSATASAGASKSVIAGSAQNLHFFEVDLNTGLPVAGGCNSTIASITFGP